MYISDSSFILTVTGHDKIYTTSIILNHWTTNLVGNSDHIHFRIILVEI
jgi:hypothetical protein